MESQTFKEAIDKNDFESALKMIQNGEDILKSKWQFKLSDTFSKLIREKQFSVLNALVENNHIEMDVFEYDNFNNTLFKELLHLDDSTESLDFLANFIGRVENLNDSLQDKTWLSLAVQDGANPEVVQAMIANGCDINYVNNHGKTLLSEACGANRMKVDLTKKKAYVQLLLDNGLDVNRKSDSGNSILHEAVNDADIEIIQLLLDQGADPNAANNEGKTPYSILINDKMKMDVAQQMAEIYPPDFDVETSNKSDLFFDYVSSYSPKKEDLEFFQMHGANPDKINEDVYGKTKTVWDVVVEKDFDFFEAFVDAFQPNVNQQDDSGNTLLHKVCAYNVNFQQDKVKDTYRKTKKLIAMGADVSLLNTSDEKAIDLAGKDNLKEKTVALILKQN